MKSIMFTVMYVTFQQFLLDACLQTHLFFLL